MGRAGSDKINRCSLVGLVTVMLVIFAFSNQPGEESQRLSDSVAATVNLPQTDSDLSESSAPLFAGLSLRKLAHIFLYAVLGLFAFLSVRDPDTTISRQFLLAVSICYIYGCSDEAHQIAVAGRTASVMDTFIDAVGFVPVIAVCCLAGGMFRRRKEWPKSMSGAAGRKR